MKVTFTYKNGRQQVMALRFAKVLASLGRGSFPSGDVQQEELAFPGTNDQRTLQQVDGEIKAANAGLLLETPAQPEIKASKAAKALAEAAKVDLSQVRGTGNDGAITKPDVEAFIAALNPQE